MKWKIKYLINPSQAPINYLFLKKGIKKTTQAKKKKILPDIDQKLSILDIIKQIEEIINKIHPNKFILLLLINFI